MSADSNIKESNRKKRVFESGDISEVEPKFVTDFGFDLI